MRSPAAITAKPGQQLTWETHTHVIGSTRVSHVTLQEQNADSSGQKAPLIPASAKPDEGLSPALSGWLLITRDTDLFSPGDSEVDRLMAAE